MKLYWHKWTHPSGTAWLLFDRKPACASSTRPLGELAIVVRLSGGYQANVSQVRDVACAYFGGIKSAVTARKLVEFHVSRKSIGMFGVDHVEFVAA